MTSVTWPGDVFTDEGGFRKPLTSLLQDMRLLEHDEQTRPVGLTTALRSVTPESVQVVTAGATTLSKVTATATGLGGVLGAGGLGALGAAATEEPAVLAVLIASSGLVLAASLLAVAAIVRADLAARATATAARYEARGGDRGAAQQLRAQQAGPDQVPRSHQRQGRGGPGGRVRPRGRRDQGRGPERGQAPSGRDRLPAGDAVAAPATATPTAPAAAADPADSPTSTGCGRTSPGEVCRSVLGGTGRRWTRHAPAPRRRTALRQSRRTPTRPRRRSP